MGRHAAHAQYPSLLRLQLEPASLSQTSIQKTSCRRPWWDPPCKRKPASLCHPRTKPSLRLGTQTSCCPRHPSAILPPLNPKPSHNSQPSDVIAPVQAFDLKTRKPLRSVFLEMPLPQSLNPNLNASAAAGSYTYVNHAGKAKMYVNADTSMRRSVCPPVCSRQALEIALKLQTYFAPVTLEILRLSSCSHILLHCYRLLSLHRIMRESYSSTCIPNTKPETLNPKP